MPFLPGLPDLEESPALLPIPWAQAQGAPLILFPETAGMQCDSAPSSWVSRTNSWERGRIYPWMTAKFCLAETPRILCLPSRTLSP